MRPAPIDPPEVHEKLWDGFNGKVGWDIGANCGQTLGEMTSRFKVVHAFEPAEECWPYIEGRAGVTVHKCALSDVNSSLELVVLPDKINTGQLVTGNCEGMEWNPNDPNATKRTVSAWTVDSMAYNIGNPDFMKIDVEGHEQKVLTGAKIVLEEGRPDLLIEFHSPELFEFCGNLLMNLDYGIEVVRHPHYPVDSPLWHQHGWIKAFS